MSFPQNCPFSVYLRKYQLVAWCMQPEAVVCFSPSQFQTQNFWVFFCGTEEVMLWGYPHNITSSVPKIKNSEILSLVEALLRVHSLPSHSLEICKLDRWEILMNTKEWVSEWVSDGKIQITNLILRRGPCLLLREHSVHSQNTLGTLSD